MIFIAAKWSPTDPHLDEGKDLGANRLRVRKWRGQRASQASIRASVTSTRYRGLFTDCEDY